jgi:hypothetical protein
MNPNENSEAVSQCGGVTVKLSEHKWKRMETNEPKY